MKSYLIDPLKQEITPLDYNGDYRSLYTLLECQTFDVAVVQAGDEELSLYIDDEGLFVESQAFFMIDGRVLAGKSAVLGCDDEGDTIGVNIELDELRKRVSWVTKRFAMAAIQYGIDAALARAVSLGMHVDRTEFGFVAFPLDTSRKA